MILPEHYQKRFEDSNKRLNEAWQEIARGQMRAGQCMQEVDNLIFELTTPTPAEVRQQERDK